MVSILPKLHPFPRFCRARNILPVFNGFFCSLPIFSQFKIAVSQENTRLDAGGNKILSIFVSKKYVTKLCKNGRNKFKRLNVT